MKKATILIIEDNHKTLENTAELLKFCNYRVFTADHGIKGIETAIEKVPDLILCDIIMGSPDGFEIIKTLRKNHITQDIPFIFLSSHPEKKTIGKAKALGATVFELKPYSTNSTEELLKTISGLLTASLKVK